jgi:hypothetical protein
MVSKPFYSCAFPKGGVLLFAKIALTANDVKIFLVKFAEKYIHLYYEMLN